MKSLLLLALVPAFSLAAERAPVPDRAATVAAEKVVRDVFKAEYAKLSAADKLAFAQKLLKQGIQTSDAPASKYVLFREAMAIAAPVGDAETVAAAAEESAKAFVIDMVPLKLDVLARVMVSSPAQGRAAALAYLKLADEAVAADNYDAALKACAQAEASARKAEDVPLTSRVAAKSKECKALQAEFLKVQAAEKTLEAQPWNGGANLAVGKFLCFVKDDWAKGLERLRKCSDDALKTVAVRDSANEPDATKLCATADSWWELAVLQPPPGSYNIRKHAAGLYAAALPRVNGLQKAKAEARLVEFEDSIPILEKFQARAKRVQAVSSGPLNQSSITIGDKTGVTGSPRGISVLAVKNNEVLLSKNYDTHARREDSHEFAEAILKLPERTLVVLAVSDEATSAFTGDAQTAIMSIGGKTGLLRKPYRSSYICVGMKGLDSGQAIEIVGQGQGQERLTFPQEDK